MGRFFVMRIQEWRHDFASIPDPDFGNKLLYAEDGATTAIELAEGETVENIGVMPVTAGKYERVRDGVKTIFTPYAFQALIGRVVDDEKEDIYDLVSADPPDEFPPPERDKKKDLYLPGDIPPPGATPIR